MSAAKLREAATAIRAEQTISLDIGAIEIREHRTWMAVADWLDDVFSEVDTYSATTTWGRHAFAIADAYLLTGFALDRYAAAADRAEGER